MTEQRHDLTEHSDAKQPHVVMRRCVSCRQLKNRQEMVGITHNRFTNAFIINAYQQSPRSKDLNGRSAWICLEHACLSKVLKGKQLQKSLKCQLPDAIIASLKGCQAEITSQIPVKND